MDAFYSWQRQCDVCQQNTYLVFVYDPGHPGANRMGLRPDREVCHGDPYLQCGRLENCLDCGWELRFRQDWVRGLCGQCRKIEDHRNREAGFRRRWGLPAKQTSLL